MNVEIFHIILSVPQNVVMDLNNVMWVWVTSWCDLWHFCFRIGFLDFETPWSYSRLLQPIIFQVYIYTCSKELETRYADLPHVDPQVVASNLWRNLDQADCRGQCQSPTLCIIIKVVCKFIGDSLFPTKPAFIDNKPACSVPPSTWPTLTTTCNLVYGLHPISERRISYNAQQVFRSLWLW